MEHGQNEEFWALKVLLIKYIWVTRYCTWRLLCLAASIYSNHHGDSVDMVGQSEDLDYHHTIYIKPADS